MKIGNKPLIVGFTGTQDGMTEEQATRFELIIISSIIAEFHHGDCIGADADAHDMVAEHGVKIVIHPPDIPMKRAFRKGTILPEKPYLVRNRDIVDASDVLLATPRENYEQRRSGTWSTIRYAQKCGKSILLIWPNGTSGRHGSYGPYDKEDDGHTV